MALTLSGCSGEKPAESTAQNTTQEIEESTAAPIRPVRLDENRFPDEVFRDFIREEFDENTDGILDEDELSKVKSIDVSAMGIESLKGIEYLSELQELHCQENPLTSLDVKDNAKLKALEVNNTTEVTGAGESVKISVFDMASQEALRHDDGIISDVIRACTEFLSEEDYYVDAESNVLVTVDPKGVITVSGMHDKESDFIKDVYLRTFQSAEPKDPFITQAYKEGKGTKIAFTFDTRLYAWSFEGRNNVPGSKFYSEDYDPDADIDTGASHGAEQKERTKINVMSFTGEVPNVFKKYAETHPAFDAQYEFSFTTVTTNDGEYQSALDQRLHDNDDDTPNIYVVDAAFVKKYTTGSASSYACTYEDLGIDVEQKIKDARIAPYVADVTRRDGKVTGLSYEGYGCAFIYNREVAKDVFGDDMPETVEAAIGSDWESFFAAAEKCKEKGYAIVSGPNDIWRAVENSADQGWIVDGKLYIDPKREAFLDYAMKLVSNDFTNENGQWSEGWFADMEETGSKKVLGFYGPSWFVNYTLKDHCGYRVDDNGNVISLGTYGQWCACRPNVASFWDGVWLVANKNVMENETLKAGVRELIEYVTLDTSTTGFQYLWANDFFEGKYAYSSSTAKKVAVPSAVVMECSDGKIEILRDQDAFPVFLDVDAKVRGDNLSEYDEIINMYWLDAVSGYTGGDYTREEAIQWFKDALRELNYFIVE